MEDIIEKVKEELLNKLDENIQATNQKFFKERIKSYGVKIPDVHKISKDLFRQLNLYTKPEIYYLCEKLWQSGYLEESFVACDWSYLMRKNYELHDFLLFEKWINEYVNNWASCDMLCNHTVAEFIEMYPQNLNRLKEFAKSDNKWVRRAAAVTLILPAMDK